MIPMTSITPPDDLSLEIEEDGSVIENMIATEFLGRGDMSLAAIKTADFELPQTIADRAAQGDAAFEAELARPRNSLHAEAQALFFTDREAHNRLIHKAWLSVRRID